MFVVNFDVLAQAIWNQKETSCFSLLNAGFEAGKSETPNHQQTECPLTNRLSYRGSGKYWTQQPVLMVSEHSAHLTQLPVGFCTWLWWYACLLLIFMLCQRQVIFKLKGDKLSSSAECRIRSWDIGHQIASRQTQTQTQTGLILHLFSCWHNKISIKLVKPENWPFAFFIRSCTVKIYWMLLTEVQFGHFAIWYSMESTSLKHSKIRIKCIFSCYPTHCNDFLNTDCTYFSSINGYLKDCFTVLEPWAVYAVISCDRCTYGTPTAEWAVISILSKSAYHFFFQFILNKQLSLL